MASLFCFYAFSPNYKYQVNKKRKEKKRHLKYNSSKRRTYERNIRQIKKISGPVHYGN